MLSTVLRHIIYVCKQHCTRVPFLERARRGVLHITKKINHYNIHGVSWYPSNAVRGCSILVRWGCGIQYLSWNTHRQIITPNGIILGYVELLHCATVHTCI